MEQSAYDFSLKMILLKNTISLFLLIACFQSQAQFPPSGQATVSGSYRHFEIADGLPQMQLTSLMVDSSNFIWASTKAGIARWDGSSFYHYNYDNTGVKEARGQAMQVIPIGGNSFIAAQNHLLLLIKGLQMTKIALPEPYKNVRVVELLPYSHSSILISYINERGGYTTPYFVYDFKKRTITDSFSVDDYIFCVVDSNTLITAEAHLPRITLYLRISGKICDSVSFFENHIFSEHSNPQKLFFYFLSKPLDPVKPVKELHRLSVKTESLPLSLIASGSPFLLA